MGVEFEDISEDTGDASLGNPSVSVTEDGERRRTWSIRISDPLGWYEANRPVERMAPSIPAAFASIDADDLTVPAIPAIPTPDDSPAASAVDTAIAGTVIPSHPSDAPVTDPDGIPFVPGEKVWDRETGNLLTVDHTGAVSLHPDGSVTVSVYEDLGSETEAPFEMLPCELTHRDPSRAVEVGGETLAEPDHARPSRRDRTGDAVGTNREAGARGASDADGAENGTQGDDATSYDATGDAGAAERTSIGTAATAGSEAHEEAASLAVDALSLVLSSLVPEDAAVTSGAAAEVETDPDSDDAELVLYAGFVTSDPMDASEVLSMLGGPSHGVTVRPMSRGGGYTLSFVRKSGRFAEDADALVAGPEEVGLPIDAVGERGASGFGMAGVRGGVPVDGNDTVMVRHRKSDRTVAMSVDTTGFEPGDDEVLQIALYGDDGRVVYARRFGTERKVAWPDAQRVNGISPDSVEGLPTFSDCVTGDEALASVLSGTDVIVAHNVPFVLGFLADAGVGLDGKLFGDTARCFKDYLYDRRMFDVRKTLSEAARVMGIGLSGHPDTPEKAWAAYAVWKALSAAGYGRLGTLRQMREEYRRSHDYRRKRAERQSGR